MFSWRQTAIEASKSNSEEEMDSSMKPPSSLSFEGNMKENWRRWKQRFEIYMKASGMDSKSEDRQIAVLLHVIGEEALDKYNTFDLTEEQKGSLVEIIKAFEEFCIPKANESVDRYLFFSRNQKEGESFGSYLTDLKKLSANCGFGEIKESLIKDRIICGIQDSKLKDSLLREERLDLNRCITLCQAAELAQVQIKTIGGETKVHAVTYQKNKQKSVVQQRQGNSSVQARGVGRQQSTQESSKQTAVQNTNYRQRQRGSKPCYKCGKFHKIRECPAFGKVCSNCSGKNHFARVCRNRNINAVQSVQLNPEQDTLFIGGISIERKKVTAWFEKVLINETGYIKVKLDSGAECNLITVSKLKQIGIKEIKIEKSKTRLNAYSGYDLEFLGKCKLRCKFNNREETELEFYLIEADNDRLYPPIIGLPSLLQLNLVRRIDSIKKVSETNDVLNEFRDVFQGIGCITNFEYKIEVRENTTGFISTSRKVPIALLEPLKKELIKMEKSNIIVKVTKPTEWINPLVIARKPTGEIRVCIDPMHLNKNLKREHFHIPTFEEVTAEMRGAKIFSTLDASQAFWQIKITDDSTEYVTFDTPFGRYKFLRMPYGIASASEVFQRCFQEAFGDIKGVKVYIDDVIVWGKDKMEHDTRLRELLFRARERNVKFNLSKCTIGVKEVRFLGNKFSEKGISLDESKVKAIVEIKSPTNKKELETFLGMITYVSRYIPNVSEVNATLRNLRKKDVPWNWDANAEKAFQELKKLLISAPVLKYYDVEKDVILSVDASQHGLGCVLLQDNLPVAYASKSLTDTETRYAQIEKEALAILFACTRFHQYIFGKEVIVESDHRPLETIFIKAIDQCPARIQRIRLSLQKYNIKVKYKPGKELLIADALSRIHIEDKSDYLEKEIEAQVCMVVESFPISFDRKEEFRLEINRDEEMYTVKKLVEAGWPKEKKLIPDVAKPYTTSCEELSLMDGLIFKGNRLVVPQKFRSEMLDLIHYTHQGLEKCKNRARDILFWPNMNRDIENKIQSCSSCMKYKKEQSSEPLLLREIPDRPWEVLGLDVFYYKNSSWLLVVDYFSKYVEIAKLENLSANIMIVKLKSIFARFGIPRVVYTDNGTHFENASLRELASQWGFELRTSSPRYPRSNGMVERYVGIVKNMFKKVDDSGRDPYLALLELRNTPISNDVPSPSELLFGHKVRGILPIHINKNKKHIIENVRNKLEERQERYKIVHDKHAHKLTPLKIEEKVYVRKEKGRPLEPAKVVNVAARPRSYEIELENGNRLERNRKHIYKSKVNHCKEASQPKNLQNVRSEDFKIATDSLLKNTCSIPSDQQNTYTPEVNKNSVNADLVGNNIVTRSGRIVRRPAYLKDYEV